MKANLFMFSEGQKTSLIEIFGIEKAKTKRMMELGLFSGAKLEILKRSRSFMIVGVRGYALCLDKQICQSILVEGKDE